MYTRTKSIIIQKDSYATYELLSGIKQRLPLSPYLSFFISMTYLTFSIHYTITDCLLDKMHLLIHADDANILSSSRELMLAMVRSMLQYCKINMIQLQLSKCIFIVINGTPEDRKEIELDVGKISCSDQLMILGSPISATGKLTEDLKLHLETRFQNCIKFFNFIRSNKLAPISVKLKVSQHA